MKNKTACEALEVLRQFVWVELQFRKYSMLPTNDEDELASIEQAENALRTVDEIRIYFDCQSGLEEAIK